MKEHIFELPLCQGRITSFFSNQNGSQTADFYRNYLQATMLNMKLETDQQNSLSFGRINEINLAY
ncbi:hypothetical protein TTHERM_001359457 (macronuclear) [Tetrahymena thermophila SB210]|uniref:Uncharacterized protein n=1 Tax=Tetrahymena thermophila (strain SB210) TaxID=312017 RepID=W7XGG4_TETTS|nr:hypothetical protein TTHERM_001359457 [Tetrahymena thermophila SB210]EWS73231.1 hypothetical protein TTHERM_001359457 [Tetrahymena thermophila SB210]|eukprot:XP_012654232.1 hypothetical protein TTHERM_001359457 [Tetrahymena thermophila SB210]